jgi:hypothetical protein
MIHTQHLKIKSIRGLLDQENMIFLLNSWENKRLKKRAKYSLILKARFTLKII